MKNTAIICKNFTQATSTYQQQAIVQQKMGEVLIQRLRKLLLISLNDKTSTIYLADLGCGAGANLIIQLLKEEKKENLVSSKLNSGLLENNSISNQIYSNRYQNIVNKSSKNIPLHTTSHLLPFINKITLVDLVRIPPNIQSIIKEECTNTILEVKQENVEDWLIEQIEQQQFYNCIISNAMVQWLKDPQNFVRNITQALEHEGIFAFTTFTPENFHELQQIKGKRLNYLSLNTWIKLLTANGFKILNMEYWDEVLTFPTIKDLLLHLRNTGVNNLEHREHWSKNKLHSFTQAYEKFKTPEGYPLTYTPLLILCRKTNR